MRCISSFEICGSGRGGRASRARPCLCFGCSAARACDVWRPAVPRRRPPPVRCVGPEGRPSFRRPRRSGGDARRCWVDRPSPPRPRERVAAATAWGRHDGGGRCVGALRRRSTAAVGRPGPEFEWEVAQGMSKTRLGTDIPAVSSGARWHRPESMKLSLARPIPAKSRAAPSADLGPGFPTRRPRSCPPRCVPERRCLWGAPSKGGAVGSA